MAAKDFKLFDFAETIQFANLPKEVLAIVRINNVYPHEYGGWVSRNSMIARDCLPEYRAAGGGTVRSDLLTLPAALDQAIARMDMRICECNELKARLVTAKAALEGGMSCVVSIT